MKAASPVLIGITPSAVTLKDPARRGGFCNVQYTEAVQRAGGVAIILPLTRDPRVLKPFFGLCHGFIISGGGDIAESTGAYGRSLTAAERDTLGNVDVVRDEMEIFLARETARRDIPVLGICRGLQVMNTALGGTLLPDIQNHRGIVHAITWTGHPLCPCRRVNSRHHQAINSLAPALQAVARSDDGIIEAAIMPGKRFFAGVQFHPEQMSRAGALFDALVSAAGSTMRDRDSTG